MRYEVTDADTAATIGSGDVPVLATPRLIAWMEAATVHAANPTLSVGQTTVGTAVRIEHRRATPVGGSVTIEAELSPSPGGRHLTLMVRAIDDRGELVADGEIDRVVVDRERFLENTARDA